MSGTDGQANLDPICLDDAEGVRQVVSSAILRLWDVVNDLTRLRPRKRERFRVTIFGSARALPGTFVYEECKRVAEALAEMGCDIVTGGGPGLMQAANEGASLGADLQSSQSVGIRIDLPFEQHVNPFVREAFTHKTFFTRLHQFVLMSDAYVVAPGGIGTVLEAMLVWQLLQVGHSDGTPLIFVGPMWRELVEWARLSMVEGQLQLADPADIQIPKCVANADEAIQVIRAHHAAWKQAPVVEPTN